MSYGPAGYEDDWDDDEFDFGDHYDPEYSAENSYPATKEASLKSHDAPKTSTLKSARVNGGFGSPSDLKSSVKGTAGRGRGKWKGIAPPKAQNYSFQSNKDVPSKKNKGQGNFLFARTKDKT